MSLYRVLGMIHEVFYDLQRYVMFQPVDPGTMEL